MKYIVIPIEFLQDEELNITECMVLAIYRYYTVEGELHCCMLRNEDICKIVRLKNDRNLQRIKHHLKELGYIRTDGGIRVTYIIDRGDIKATPGVTLKPGDIKATHNKIIMGDTEATPEVTIESSMGDIKATPGVTFECQKGDIKATHNKREKELLTKEPGAGGAQTPLPPAPVVGDIKDTPEGNLGLLLNRLPKEYLTPEKIDYIKDNFIDRLNQVNLNDGSTLDSWIIGIKAELNNKFPMYEKPIPASALIDNFFD